MASPQQQKLLQHNTEVSCDASGDGAVSVRIHNSNKPLKHLQPQQQQHVSGDRGGGGGGAAGGTKPCKYSISSSCSSGESGVRKTAVTGLRSQRRVPQLFERSAAQWWDLRFDSSILEKECRERCFPQTRRRFRYVLFYLAAAALLWGVYFGANGARCDPAAFLLPTATFLLFCLLLFLFTFTQLYGRFYNQASLLLVVVTFAITLVPQTQTDSFTDHGRGLNLTLGAAPNGGSPPWVPCISPVGTFSLSMEVLLLLYSVLHVRLYASVLLGLLYSVLFEVLGWLFLLQASGGSRGKDPEGLVWLVPAKALLHLCAHAIGIHLFIMSEVRSRSTFLKVGQAIMHGKDLEVEKALKERMIHSVMPRRVADELMKQGDEENEGSGKRYSASGPGGGPGGASTSSSPKGHKRKKTSIPRGQIIFRPFNMKRMEPVSILFADIVGFTKMSANKSAHALVGLLNDLFGRFDRLCELTRCEKISTLGDCYYCVAGCPEPRPDHAYCCVEMGLGMIQAIEQFCQETREMVNMRVGVHTGTVLCGILGMKRFKFDVWSNDVNLANLMEQLGVAGKVHLSQATAGFLDDRYHREDGRVTERVGQSVVAEQLKGMKTYLISGRKVEQAQCTCAQLSVAGQGLGDLLSPASCPHTPDVTGLDSTPLPHTPHGPPTSSDEHTLPDKAKSPCLSCSVLLQVEDQTAQEGAVQNGCQEENKTNSRKVLASRNPKALNGLLSPALEEGVTNSQTSLCEMLQEKEKKWGGAGALDHSALIPMRSKNFRERSDAHFVEVIKEDNLMKDYFFNPPINKLSLNFLKRSLESAYRTSYQVEVEMQAPVLTFASPTFSSFLDVFLSCSVFLALTLACFLRPWLNGDTPPTLALALATGAALLEGVSLAMSIRMAFFLDSVLSCAQKLLKAISGWIPRHMIGAVLVSLPAVSVFTHLTCSSHMSIQFIMFICCAVIIAIIQYCNFCQLSSWMRSVLATMAGVALLALLYSPLCRASSAASHHHLKSSNLTNISSETGSTTEPESDPLGDLQAQLGPEAILAFFLVLLLLWFLNREFEVSYRLHYHGNVEADQHRIKIQNMRDQADWLLGNIIPIHVAEQLKVTQSYSKNHDNVGVIFASIVNFSEFYEESYEGGKECYRVLNELIGDFDELLRQPAFASVEKIKTIGATYMAASGLNARQSGGDPPARPQGHLRALLDFALEMMRVVEDFNKNMLGFQFKLRVGFNHGPLTAGVIGTTKLLYDIWGDTVNIASRMDSTGVQCRVQVSEESHRALSRMGYGFDYRGTVNVKGKGQMRTFLFPRSTHHGGPIPQHRLAADPEVRSQVDPSIDCFPAEEIAGSFSGKAPTPAPAPVPPPVSEAPRPETGLPHDAMENYGRALDVQSRFGFSGPAPAPSPPPTLAPHSTLAPASNSTSCPSAAQTTSIARASSHMTAPAQPAPPRSVQVEVEVEVEVEAEAEEKEEEEGEEEEEANELTRLRAAERL